MVSKVAKTNLAKLANSRADRTSPASRAVSNVNFRTKGPANAGPFLVGFASIVRRLPLPD